jgi:hypothetical protein
MISNSLCQLFHFWGQPDKKDWGQADHCTAQQWGFFLKIKFKIFILFIYSLLELVYLATNQIFSFFVAIILV